MPYEYEIAIGQPGRVIETNPPPDPVPTLAQRKASILAKLPDIRYRHEIGGATISGVPVKTDRESQALITGAALAATLDSEYTVNWKGTSGWVELDATTIIALAQGIRAHVQACFDNEKALEAAINDAADDTALDAIDINAGWP